MYRDRWIAKGNEMLAILDMIASQSHLFAIVAWHGQSVLCQLSVSHGQEYANGCVTLP